MSDCVVDSSVLLTIIRGEPGQAQAKAVLPGSLLSTVNLSEVVAKLGEQGAGPGDIQRIVLQLPCTIIGFDEEQAFTAGALRAATAHKGLSLGDRACLALALHRRLPAWTADRAWTGLELGVDVRLIR
jgi:PIN domain nuclease of toxin-antitoxin system